ncbi:amidohydrolase family protein [Maribacter sp. R77961]|jgi:hypothetical protein|uniref:amidohydrolase family protein n=1 Tax=Maribacter sp. R77961 TaxID=3093871 RepID=UPI0037C902A3
MVKSIAHFKSLLFLFILIAGCKNQEETLYDIVLKNGSVIDLETGSISRQTIGITDGVIMELKSTTTNVPLKAKLEIDVEGKYLLPGFWDNHVHFRGGDSLIGANKKFLKLFMANGITTVRDAGGDLTTSVMAWKSSITEGTLVGPTIFTSGPKIDGKGATWAGSLEVENEEEIRKALDSLEQIPVDFVKLYDSRISGKNYLNTIGEAEKRGLITSGHMPFTVTLEETIDAGIDTIEHLYYIMKGCASNEVYVTNKMKSGEIGFWDAMPLLMESYSDTTATNTFTTLKKNNVYVVPTLHIGKTLSYLDENNHTKDPYLKYMTPGIIKTYEGRINRVKNSKPEAIANRKQLDTFFGSLAKSLSDAGVGLLAGSDCGAYNSYTYPGVSLHKELQEMVTIGISPLEALRTSAYNGAKFLKKDANYGTLKKGKVADIVVLDGNPLEQINNTEKIHYLIKNNNAYSAVALKALLKSALIVD